MTRRLPDTAPDRGLRESLAQLPREVAPRNDPWPAISARLGPRTPVAGKVARSGKDWLVLAAAVSLALLVGIFLGERGSESQFRHGPNLTQDESRQPLEVAVTPGLIPALSTGEAEYLAALNLVQESIPASEFTGHMASVELSETWQTLRQLEGELWKALSENPDNRMLQQRWLSLREQQVHVLHAMTEAGESPGRLAL